MKSDLEKPKSLAEFILVSTKNDTTSASDSSRSVARQLPGIPRISYDKPILEAVGGTAEIELETILGGLEKSSFLFDKFWIEGPTFLDNHGQSNERQLANARVGMLVTSDQTTHSFKFTMVMERFGWDAMIEATAENFYDRKAENLFGSKEMYMLHAKGRSARPTIDGKTISCEFDGPTFVSPEKINLNDNALMNELISQQKDTAGFMKISNERTIDDLHHTAEFLARFFVLFSSDRFINNLEKIKRDQSQDLSRINKKRLANGKLPLVPVSPLKIDISEADRQVLESGTVKEKEVLLGVTRVRRSKPIKKPKNPGYFTRKAHMRRTHSPIDRSEAVREVTSTQAVTLSMEGERPAVTRKLADSFPSKPG